MLFVPALSLVAADAPLSAEAKAVKRDVVVPGDTSPFSVQKDQVVRITGEGIAGAKITAKVFGPATILAENSIRPVRGGHPVIGPGNREFEIRPTGKGKVKVTITSTPPQPDAKPTVTDYQFTVK
jgi:hypothetical protein